MISEQEIAIAESLINTDEEKPVVYQHDFQINEKILGILISDRHFLVQSMDLIKPEYFEDDGHRLICSIVFDFFKEYGGMPSKAFIQNEIKTRRKNSEHIFQYLGELEIVLAEYLPGADSREYLMDKIVEFAKEQAARCAVSRTMDILKKKPEGTWNKIWELWRTALTTDKGHDIGLEYLPTLEERYERLNADRERKEIFTTGFKGIDDMLSCGGLARGEIGAFVGLSGSGKCFQSGTGILMFDGTIKNVEDIKVGDVVMGDDSTPRMVLNLHSGRDIMYAITPVKGEKYVVNSQHILVLKPCGYNIKKNGKKYERYTQSKWRRDDGLVEIPVCEFLKQTNGFKQNLKGLRTKINFKKEKVKINPYFLGIWLGDGSEVNADVTTMDEEVVEFLSEEAISRGLTLTNKGAKGKANTYSITNVDYYNDAINHDKKYVPHDSNLAIPKINGRTRFSEEIVHGIFKLYHEGKKVATIARIYNAKHANISSVLKGKTWKHCNETPIDGSLNRNHNSLIDDLKYYGLIKNKHVPSEYKANNRWVRLQILAGLIDSDGNNSSNCYDFINKNKTLACDVVFIARSLGFAAYISQCVKKSQNGTPGVYWRVSISGECSEIPVKIPRKKCTKRKQIKNPLVTGIEVSPIGNDFYYGFETDGNNRFVLGDFTVVHNSIALINSAYSNLLMSKKVCYITLEMNQDKIAQRFDSLFSRIEYRSLRDNQNYVIKEIRENFKHLDSQRLVIKHYAGGTAGVDTLRAYLSQLSLYNFSPDLLVVDYVGEFKDIPGIKTYESRQLLVRELRTLAIEENMCVLTAFQANRKGREIQEFEGSIDDDAIADAFGMARPMDAMWSLNKIDGSNLGHIYVMKHRDGRSKEQIWYELDTLTLRMNEINHEQFKEKRANFLKKKANNVDSVIKKGQ